MPSRPLLLSLAWMMVTVFLGLAVRFAPLGLPYFMAKYGGSMLWAAAIYWLVTTVWPAGKISVAGAVAAAVAAGIEFLKLVHLPELDSFRHTLAGVLLLGRFFSLWDFFAYWLGIAVAVLLDLHLRRAVWR